MPLSPSAVAYVLRLVGPDTINESYQQYFKVPGVPGSPGPSQPTFPSGKSVNVMLEVSVPPESVRKYSGQVVGICVGLPDHKQCTLANGFV